eukprot:gene26696-48095_t
MRSTDLRPKTSLPLATWVVVCLLTAAAPLSVLAQTTAMPAPKPLSTPLMALDWKDLSTVHRQTHKPLESTWDTLNDGHKRRWNTL